MVGYESFRAGLEGPFLVPIGKRLQGPLGQIHCRRPFLLAPIAAVPGRIPPSRFPPSASLFSRLLATVNRLFPVGAETEKGLAEAGLGQDAAPAGRALVDAGAQLAQRLGVRMPQAAADVAGRRLHVDVVAGIGALAAGA